MNTAEIISGDEINECQQIILLPMKQKNIYTIINPYIINSMESSIKDAKKLINNIKDLGKNFVNIKRKFEKVTFDLNEKSKEISKKICINEEINEQITSKRENAYINENKLIEDIEYNKKIKKQLEDVINKSEGLTLLEESYKLEIEEYNKKINQINLNLTDSYKNISLIEEENALNQKNILELTNQYNILQSNVKYLNNYQKQIVVTSDYLDDAIFNLVNEYINTNDIRKEYIECNQNYIKLKKTNINIKNIIDKYNHQITHLNDIENKVNILKLDKDNKKEEYENILNNDIIKQKGLNLKCQNIKIILDRYTKEAEMMENELIKYQI